MFTVYISVLALAGLQCSVSGAMVKLSPTVTTNIDLEARKQLLFLIVEQINNTVTSQSVLINECEQKINESVDACVACQSTRCTGSSPVPLDTAIKNTILAGLNYPVVYAGKGLEAIGKWFAGSTSWMGKRGVEFSNTMKGTANTVGNTLEQSGNTALNVLGQGFANLGTTFENIGKKIADFTKESLNSIKDFGKTIANLDNLIGEGFKDFDKKLSGFVSNIGTGISNTAQDIWSKTFGQLGRKKRSAIEHLRHKRCTASCPTCNNLDTTTYTVDQITEKICGAGSVKSRTDAVNDVTWLQELYNKTISEVLISEIQFDSTQIDFSTGTATFSVSKYTIDTTTYVFGGILDPSNQEATGKAIADEYFAKIWAVRSTV